MLRKKAFKLLKKTSKIYFTLDDAAPKGTPEDSHMLKSILIICIILICFAMIVIVLQLTKMWKSYKLKRINRNEPRYAQYRAPNDNNFECVENDYEVSLRIK